MNCRAWNAIAVLRFYVSVECFSARQMTSGRITCGQGGLPAGRRGMGRKPAARQLSCCGHTDCL